MSFLDNIEQIITLYPLVAFGAVFLAGVISSVSPCVLATVPLVVGFVGGYSDGDRTKAFRYSLAFVLGLGEHPIGLMRDNSPETNAISTAGDSYP